MGSLSKRFKALIAWAESQKTEDVRLAAYRGLLLRAIPGREVITLSLEDLYSVAHQRRQIGRRWRQAKIKAILF